ncbi:energy-coupling factor transporter transmembrane component T [Mobiluncus mulieris]|uniref:energy-coupling factor transporter transmembrane component T n=1 Tax=Mobiluncus mulieris TaxID=2052 RepID=UPI00242F1BC9|nr:energy-coupling factor transporter transmembrane component T [Mobiluncus mulieris]
MTPRSHPDTQPAAPADAATTPNPVNAPTASRSALGSANAGRENLCAITPAMLSFGTTTDRLRLDPRTKLLAALTINILVLGRVAPADLLACFGFTAILLATTVRWRLILGWASGFVFLLGGAWLATYAETSASGVSAANTAANSALDILVFAGLWMSRFVVAGGIFWYLIASTSSGQLTAALTRMQLPRAVIVPVTVMLRYVPSALADLRAIFDTMRLRGVAPTWGRVLAHPGHTVEFILVPLLASSTRIADDLTASGLVRGLGKRGRRTCVWPIGFGGADLVVVLVLVALVASRFVGR